MKRLFWLGLGVAAGALAVRQMSKMARAYSPSGVAASTRQSAVGLVDSVRDFMADVREGMAQREEQIQDAFARGAAIDDLSADELTDDHGVAH